MFFFKKVKLKNEWRLEATLHWRRKWPRALSRPKIGKGEPDPERVVGKIKKQLQYV